jgi:hypothetical protein
MRGELLRELGLQLLLPGKYFKSDKPPSVLGETRNLRESDTNANCGDAMLYALSNGRDARKGGTAPPREGYSRRRRSQCIY